MISRPLAHGLALEICGLEMHHLTTDFQTKKSNGY